MFHWLIWRHVLMIILLTRQRQTLIVYEKILTSGFANFFKSFLCFETVALNWPHLITGGGKKLLGSKPLPNTYHKRMIFFIVMCSKHPGLLYTTRYFLFKLLIKIPIMWASKSHLLIFTSAYLHICSPSHLLTFSFLL